MKTLVIYYSLSGNTRFIAEQIAAATNADLLELKPRKEINARGFSKFFQGGKQVMTKAQPQLVELDKDPGNYDLIFIGTPVWAGTYAPAIRTFLSCFDLAKKKIALFCCFGGSKGSSLRNLGEALEGNDIVGEIGFKDPLKHGREGKGQKVREWAGGILAGESP